MVMMRSFSLVACVAGVWAVAAGAQPATRKDPAVYAGPARVSRAQARPAGLRLGLRRPRELALAPLSASEAAHLAEGGTRKRIGIHRALPDGALDTGAWQTTVEGTAVWRMAIRSPGSSGIRVKFRNFSVGAGKVWLYDGSQVAGPYTGRGIFDNGRFWSATIFSESVTLEYDPDPAAAASAALPFEIRTIAHRAQPAGGNGLATLAGADAGVVNTADSCHLDPNCYPDWKPAMSMVAQLSYEDGGDQYLCSGALVSTRDNSFKPYLLTAGHCIHSEDSARSLETYWTYQTSSCGGPPPASRDTSAKSSLGAHLIDYGTIENGDYSLVLLKDVPANVTFSGWDIADPPLATALTGIHHPAGSWKRISFGERAADQTVVVEDAVAPSDEYLQVLWDEGRTEPGSSGSPLFTSPGVIVGSLTYGPASPTLSACQISPAVDGYGRFSNAYQYLKDYLENLPAAQVTPDQAALSFSVTDHATPAAQTVLLSTQSSGQAGYKLRADAAWIRVSPVSGSVSAGEPAPISISVDPSQVGQAGQYSSTVTILSGAADPVFLDVTVTVRIDLSAVVASITPNPVVQSGGQWNFRIRLTETAGAATRVTGMKINGADYSSSIAAWFGTDSIAAGGAIQVPLNATGSFPPGTQYFEFWGVDAASGQTWYRVATANFQ